MKEQSSPAALSAQESGPEHGVPARREALNPGENSAALFRAYRVSRDLEIRNRLVLHHQRLVYYVARQFRAGGGNSLDDLIQVGFLGLIEAIERYDPDAGATFVTYAMPTIVGVLKHYLRDQSWVVKAPRRLRELGMRLRKVRARLEYELGRSPTMAELAEATGFSEERLIEAMDVEQSYQPASLDAPVACDPGEARHSFWETMGRLDDRLTEIELREAVASAISRLDRRQQTIIRERFFSDATQSEVAAQLGVSQMHVSRLERQAIRRLRGLLM
jgi:RNA polymerase sigma-B factor